MADKQVVIFGAGDFGHRALKMFSQGKVAFFVDNDTAKAGKSIEGIPIRLFNEVKRELPAYDLVVAVNLKFRPEILRQLADNGLHEGSSYFSLQKAYVKKQIEQRTDYLGTYQRAIAWVQSNSLPQQVGQAIRAYADTDKGYPEVTGYFIPTLIRLGYRDLAISYTKWLLSLQKPDGSWYDMDDVSPYVFDTAQILKGLLAVRAIYPVDDAVIRRGCDWLLSNMQPDGRLTTPDEAAVGNTRVCSELIHLYCLSPLVEAGKLLHEPRYGEAARQILHYYVTQHYEEIVDARILTHFHAYIIEGLLDMGEKDLAAKAMQTVERRQREDGMIPAYPDVHWTCSTGLFQFALIWYRLGNIERGDKAFKAGCRLQNKSGGWFGSYMLDDNTDETNDYWPISEISWASKFFFDALYYKNVANFNYWSPQFAATLDRTDERYQLILTAVKQSDAPQKVLDVGCAKGRYLRNLLTDCPKAQYFGVDIAVTGMQKIGDERIHWQQGTLTNIPYADDTFAVTYACESLEHAIDIQAAIREMSRVTRSHGKIVIMDKNKDALGCVEITPWEQYFDEEELRQIMERYCSKVVVHHDVSYKDAHIPGLSFSVWLGEVK